LQLNIGGIGRKARKFMFKEKTPSPEGEKETKIVLEFMRHGKRIDDTTKPNEELILSEEGRLQAHKKGEELNPQTEVSVAWGSPKKRTQETATHSMLANEEIDPKASLEEMEEAIAKELKVGKKIIEDERLDFDLSGPEGKEMIAAFKEGKYLQFVVEKSDQRAIELGDKVSSTYTRYAGNIAEIIDRYAQIGNNFNRIASKTDKYEKFGNQLERYLASHQGVVEGFIMKVLEKTEGKEKRDEFIKSVGGGFKETQGIHIEIINKGNEQAIGITYEINGNKETLEIDKKLLEEIIKERRIFEEQVDKNVN